MSKSTTPVITVAVASYDRHALLGGVIESILKQDLDPAAYEIVIVDNSPDRAAAMESSRRFQHIPNLRYVLEPTAGAPNARNMGAHLARGRFVAFLDDDAIAAPNWLRRLLAAFEAVGDRVGAVGGRVTPRWLAPRPAWLHDDLLSYLTIIDRGERLRELAPAEWVASCNIAFDRAALIAVGGFSQALGRIGSEAVLLSNEDIEVCRRIRASGRLTVYAPDAVVEHLIDPSRLTHTWFRRRSAWQAVSDFIMNPPEAERNARSYAAELRRMPRLGQNAEPDDPDAFKDEIYEIYMRTLVLLTGEQASSPRDSTALAAVRRLVRKIAR